MNVLPDSYLQKLKAALRSRDKAAVEQAVEDICRRMTKKSPSPAPVPTAVQMILSMC